MLGLDAKTWLGLSVLGAIVSTFGALVGVFLKDYLFTRSFERWKQQRTLEQVYERYRDPLYLAAREFVSRVAEVDKHYPTVYLREAVLETKPKRQVHNTIDDPYFQRHKLLSTVYRLMSLLGWLELYRQEITYLRPGRDEHSNALENAVEFIRSDLADGQLNDAADWSNWRDTLIFREELRAIGESMHESRGASRSVMGYGHFCEQLETDGNTAVRRWFPVCSNFFFDLEDTGKDFRRVRLKRLVVHGVDLMLLLNKAKVEQEFVEKRNSLHAEVIAPHVASGPP